MVTPTKRYTVQEFDEWVDLPQNADKLFEYIGGKSLRCLAIRILQKSLLKSVSRSSYICVRQA